MAERNKRIYLAGKIGKDDWRSRIVRGFGNWKDRGFDEGEAWPVLPRAILNRFDYVGPYHEQLSNAMIHGFKDIESVNKGNHCDSSTGRGCVIERCLFAIVNADLVFVWLDSIDAYGTFAEIGYARGILDAYGMMDDYDTPSIYIASPPGFDPNRDAWFSCNLADGGGCCANTPEEALLRCVIENGWMFDSPIERHFWNAWQRTGNGLELTLQHEVFGGKYRLDFAHLATKTAIELDGFAYHSDRQKFKRDRKRDRELTHDGWRVIRFAADEINQDIERCVNQTACIIHQALVGDIGLRNK